MRYFDEGSLSELRRFMSDPLRERDAEEDCTRPASPIGNLRREPSKDDTVSVNLMYPCLRCKDLEIDLRDGREYIHADSFSGGNDIIITGQVIISCSHFHVCKKAIESGNPVGIIPLH